MIKILLVAPRLNYVYGKHYVFPIGLAYVSSSLKQAGYTVKCLNLNNSRESALHDLALAMSDFDPDIVGCGGLSVHFSAIKEIFDTAKLMRPSVFLLSGGGIISSEPELMLNGLGADVGVIGEAEETVVRLMEALMLGTSLYEVRGIVFRSQDGVPVRTPEAPHIKKLDDIPWPDYEGFGFEEFLAAQRTTDDYFYHTDKVPRSLDIVSSRSCPYDCSFCFHPLGRVYRERSLDNFFAELDYMLKHYHINRVAVLDELFAVKKKRLVEFCQRIKPYGIKWMAQLRIDILDKEILNLMQESNCQVISYSIESACDSVLVGMEKKITRSQIDHALALSYTHRIGIQGNLIFGDSSETEESILESLRWWGQNRHYTIWLTPIQHYPGTKIYQDAVQKGAIANRMEFHQKGCPLVNTTSIPEDRYWSILNEIIFIAQVTSYPGRLLSFERAPVDDPLRGAIYTTKCVCPHCYQIDTHACLTYDGSGRPLQRITCHHCQQRYDIPRSFNEIKLDPLAETFFGLAAKHFTSQDLRTAANILVFSLARENRHANSHYLLGLILQVAGELGRATTCLRNALQLDPLNDDFHAAYAEIMRNNGQPIIAEIFESQVAILRSARTLVSESATNAPSLLKSNGYQHEYCS